MTDFNFFHFIVGTIISMDDHELAALTVSGLVRKLNISKSLLYYLFKVRNYTPAEFMTRTKISRAEALLKNKKISVKELSQRMGYHSPDYFIRLFKTYFGITPGKYRKYSSRQESKEK
ncbi:MAG: helix-turn-helix transcriptional regulator [Candidatus Aminicenantes bacterium]|nr:MAG: helix-turn-helix transcriptional regulator [Candidatus Aminicenantes bacterium]